MFVEFLKCKIFSVKPKFFEYNFLIFVLEEYIEDPVKKIELNPDGNIKGKDSTFPKSYQYFDVQPGVYSMQNTMFFFVKCKLFLGWLLEKK